MKEDHGLAALPAPSALDIFLDLEGDRQAEHGGLEYLFGYALRDAGGVLKYEALWALSPTAEKRAFETLIDLDRGAPAARSWRCTSTITLTTSPPR